MMKRLIWRIASGWSKWVRMQVFSHRWSHTRPRIDGSGLSSRVSFTASRKFPSRTAFMYCGTFWSTGHSSTHGASMQSK